MDRFTLKVTEGVVTVCQWIVVLSVLGIFLFAVEPSALDEMRDKVKYLWYAVLPT